ncbi:kielin/chordin-like protein [Oncorhynchus nerka]|uniref:kielin/chordin-like protein n=1 Tax=Oncorhynchus nerka TaxID=8023 RepID=UPI0011312EEE|nr:kielin/chordin-like protein [Oncorhynchus nerka]
MEVRWLKTLLCVWLSVCSSLRAHPIDTNHENVINLLEALNMSRPLKGVSKVQGEWPGTQAYKLRPRSPHLTLPEQYSHYLVSSLQGSLGIHLMARQGADSSGTLLSFSSSSSSSPLLQLYSSTRSKSLRLDHQAGLEGQGLASVLFPGGSPFSGGGWVRLALALEAGRVSLFVDCREAVVIQRDKEERVKLQLPPDLVITLASTQGDMESKFTGYVQTAEISTRAYQRRPWQCDNITDSLQGPPHAQLNNSAPVNRVDSGPGLEPQHDIANYQPHNPSLHPHHPQGDQPQRGGVLLGPPSPHGVKPVSQSQGEDWLRGLEERLEGLERMLDMVKAQNVDLQARVQYLEGCECVRRGCVWEGRQVEEGHRWETHRNTFCTCTSGQVTCSAPTDGCKLDGHPYNSSVNTIDGCQTCTCKEGSMVCSPPSCPPLDCSEQETLHGECCPRCRGCIHTGIHYHHRAKWRPSENPCSLCYCLEGVVKCETERCSPPCRNPSSPPPNTCCPVCHGCGMNGQDFLNGAQVPSVDRCQECVCMNGDVLCSPRPCPAVSCPNSVRRPGDCCPRCEQCEYDSQVLMFPSRTDPCLRCHCSDGEVSCERMDASCPPLRCSHPATPRGQCCPTCDQCEYERRVYVNGNVFNPAGSGPCVQCSCKDGNVGCQEERCPPVQCSNLINNPQFCCPICKVCVLEGLKYEEGSQWQVKGCTNCTCLNGEVVCTHTHCPPTACTHPTKTTGLCCAECERCTFDQRIYSNRQTFTHPDQPCHTCTCLEGTVQCVRRACPPLNCSNTHTPHGECCPKCPDCSFENRVFVDGEVFPSPVSVCEECVCVSGRVDCHASECPRPHCTTPLPGTCCQNNCNGCSYAGKEYPNGQEFLHPTDNCRTCHCINGNVQCLMRRCPPLACSIPNLLPGECCPQCPIPPADCVYEGRPYRHTERFYDPTDPCRSCLCTNGTSRCQRKPCPLAHCSHPIQQECCRTCDGCLYEGRDRANGESWGDVSDPCGVCVCREGSVHCERKRCPAVSCPYPIQRECCLACDGCMYGGTEYPDGYEFLSGQDPCRVCTCYVGDVVCSQLPCYQDCTHPYKPPGQCCGECNRCSHGNVVLISGQSILDPTDPCSECSCQGGSVRCVKKLCPPASCSHPANSPCGCPLCDGCVFQGGAYVDGQVFPGTRGTCETCTCSRGEVVCVKRRCPAVSCPHPALDGCACGVCDGCRFNGRDCSNGERFPHPSDHCQRCTCLNGGVVCVSGPCPPVVCARPVVPPGECCPICRGVCLYQGEEFQSGASFTPPIDPCSTCSCLNEVVTCHKKLCPVQCSHPLPFESSNGCCPLCEACLYGGVVYSNRQTFTPAATPLTPELANPCQRCTCVKGSVSCMPLFCPPTSCPQPITLPGDCCPQCAVCVYQGEEYSDRQQWNPSSNLCTACTCQAGKVQCVGPDCPKLTCMHQLTEPGTCCPRCRGCVYDGEEHAEGSSWFADSTPCMSCMCVDGVTTCSEVRCLSPCINTITVPGECCPVCADCVFEGRVYGPGDSFHPADDPCHICTCEVMPDGEQHLRCYRKQCPSLVDCVKSNILFSGPDSCCPVCAQPLSNCTATLIGNEVLATDDPCFTCQCKDLTWTCLHQSCPPLSCRPEEHHTPPDSCCPVCDECVMEGEKRHVSNGESWTDSEDECVTCTCNLGYIECSIEECVPVECEQGLVRMKTPGKCCYECQDSGAQCVYQGSVYQSNEQWEVDECTSCTCVFGDVHCYSQRCPPLGCAADETPAVIPGVCCPHCIPRPATCVAFGDPHYRTFDGRMLHFQGACTYILSQDCDGGDFSIHATNDDRGRKGVSWTKEVTVFIGDVVVQLLQDWVVRVDYKVVTLPFLKEPYIYLERQTNTILLNTNIGLKVLWSGRSHLEVSIPGSYKGHTCGLCGNFNNYPQDDLRTPAGKVSQSEADFGNSWKVGSGNGSLSCQPGEDIDPCKAAGYQARKSANARCRVLKSAVFHTCHHLVAPEPWYAACVYDLCACGANADECLCDALEAYAAQCREAGARLSWRSSSLCAVGCPVERGFVFDECGPPCPVTCVNRDVPLGVIESHCFKPCVPGCQCPAGLVLHNNHCVPPETCPKIIHGKS